MLVCAATFMLLLDVTVVTVALPTIERDLSASLSDLQWVIDAYTLVLAVLLLPAATLGDRLGRRRLFLGGLVLFTAGSLACALAPSALSLELFRAFQGIGGAVLFATGTPLLRAEFSGQALPRALGFFGATIGGATAIGPLAGGALTDAFGWRSIFYINLPVGALVFVAGVLRLRESRGQRRPGRLARDRGDDGGPHRPHVRPHPGQRPRLGQRRRHRAVRRGSSRPRRLRRLRAADAAPMADLRLFARRSFTATGFIAFAVSATVIGVISYLALYLQNTLGYSAVQGGLRFLALSLVSFAVAPLTGRLIGRVPMRMLLGTAMIAATAGLASMARLSAGSGWLVLLPGLILSGIGLGICSTALSTAALSAVEPRPGRDGGRPGQHAAAGRDRGRGGRARRAVHLAGDRGHPGRPELAAGPRRGEERAGGGGRLRRRNPGGRRGAAGRPRRGHPRRPGRDRLRAERRADRGGSLRRARRDRRIRVRARPGPHVPACRPGP